MGCCHQKFEDKDIIFFDNHSLIYSKQTRASVIFNKRFSILKEMVANKPYASKLKLNHSGIVDNQIKSECPFDKAIRRNSISNNRLTKRKKSIVHLNKLSNDSDDRLNKSDDEPTQKRKSIGYSKYLFVFQDDDKPLNCQLSQQRKLAHNNLIKNFQIKTNISKCNDNNNRKERDDINDGDLANFNFDCLNTK